MMEFIALGHNCSLNHRGESGIEAGQILGSGEIDTSENKRRVSGFCCIHWLWRFRMVYYWFGITTATEIGEDIVHWGLDRTYFKQIEQENTLR